jgi:hypothetical protein
VELTFALWLQIPNCRILAFTFTGPWHVRGSHSTDGLFPKDYFARKVIGEQFWGRAARASNDSKESGRLLIFGRISSRLIRVDPWKSVAGFSSISRNRKIHRDARFCLYRLA